MSTTSSEVNCYKYILDELEKKGWEKRNVYSQQECHHIPEIKKHLVLDRPENIVEINEKIYYVIEGKNEKRKIDVAVSEARDQYAKKINQSSKIKALFITGVAGNNDEGYISQSFYYNGKSWNIIKENGIAVSSILSPLHVETILKNNSSLIEDVEISEEEFLNTAIEINKNLHENSINKDYRARFISAILLSMLDGEDINISQEPLVLINNINTKVKLILKRHGKGEFSQYIKIDEPSSADNHTKVKNAIKTTYQYLLDLNIRSAMNSGKDVLGKFYEVFLKYGNGAKEIGIVLTPRHITKFAAYTLDITSKDLVLDLACGTGGFLVSAYDEVKRKTKNTDEFDTFKNHGIYGIEEQDQIISLAIVNMIFRGDGKTNMIEGDCFKKWLTAKVENGTVIAQFKDEDRDRIRPITKVMINPPFSQKTKEYKFINQALDQMHDEGILFSILPVGVLVKQKAFLQWRKELLLNNTLLVVVTFPEDLFYPLGTHTLGLYVKKGIPHAPKQKVLWIKVDNDGYRKTKGKRLPSKLENNQLSEVEDIVKSFIKNQDITVTDKEEYIKVESIAQDRNLELIPHAYLEEKKPSDEKLLKNINNTLRDFIASMIKYNSFTKFRNNILREEPDFFNNAPYPHEITWKEVHITDIFKNPIKTGFYHVSNELDVGKTPLVSCVATDCGFEGFFNIENTDNIVKNAITISSDGQPLTCFYHYYPFTAKDNVLVCHPTKKYKFTTLLLMVTQINILQWRFSYGRKCYENKVHKIKIYLPYDSEDNIDENYINYIFKNTEAWKILETLFK